MNKYDKYLIYICLIFSLLIFCAKLLSKIEFKNKRLIVGNDTLNGQWTDQDMFLKGTISVGDELYLGAVNKDITITVQNNVHFKGNGPDHSRIYFRIAPNKKVSIISNNRKSILDFSDIAVRFPNLMEEGRKIELRNVTIAGNETADFAAPTIESIALIMKQNTDQFKPIEIKKAQVR